MPASLEPVISVDLTTLIADISKGKNSPWLCVNCCQANSGKDVFVYHVFGAEMQECDMCRVCV